METPRDYKVQRSNASDDETAKGFNSRPIYHLFIILLLHNLDISIAFVLLSGDIYI
jgi:hypothetical protein